MKYLGVTILFLSLWPGSLAAQTRTGVPSPGSKVVVRSGGYQLTEGMIQQDLQYGQIVAGADFSPSEVAAIRALAVALINQKQSYCSGGRPTS